MVVEHLCVFGGVQEHSAFLCSCRIGNVYLMK